MKKLAPLTRSALITLCILLVATIPAFAGSTLKTLSTNYTVVNLSTTTDASVTALYYKDSTSGGSNWDADNANENFTVPMNYGQKVIRQYFDTTMSSGKGSVVLSSTEPLAAIVQIQARNQTASLSAYNGYTSGSNKFFVPSAFKNFTSGSGKVNTQIMVQNIMNEAISADIEFVPSPGRTGANNKHFASIPAYATEYFDLADQTTAFLPDEWIGSAVVTAQASKQVAVVFNTFTGTDGLATVNGFPVESVGTTWAIPQFDSKLTNGLNIGIVVQNVSGADIAAHAMTLACKPGTGSTGDFNTDNTTLLPDKGSYSFNPYGNAAYPPNWEGSCLLTAPANVVPYVQLRRPGVTSDISSYEAFNGGTTNTKVVIPLVIKRLSNGYCAGSVIQNISTTDTAFLHLTYNRSAESTVGDLTYTKDVTLLPGAMLNDNLRLANYPTGLDGGKSMPDGWQGSLVITTQAGHTAVPVVAYVIITSLGSPPGDNWMAYQAFNVAP
jgi:hypothetical protein